MSACAIVNPRSGGGRTGKRMAEIEAALKTALGDVTVVRTSAQGDGMQLARDALKAGHKRIIAIGGDGTLNEVVNGFFEDGQPIAPDAEFSFAMSGSGGDFRRSFAIEGDVLDCIARLKGATARRIDLGRVTYTTSDGGTASRLFVNIASFGLSGDIVNRVNRARIAKWFGGPFAFKWHSIMGALAFKPWRVRLQADDGPEQTLDLSTVAICNGRYFGGGMMIAPSADPGDGLFDVVTIAETNRKDMIARMNDIYTGAHVNHPNVKVFRARRLTATPVAASVPAVYAELDGEGGMRLLATFEIMPGALTLSI